jgi:hypothetical protein
MKKYRHHAGGKSPMRKPPMFSPVAVLSSESSGPGGQVVATIKDRRDPCLPPENEGWRVDRKIGWEAFFFLQDYLNEQHIDDFTYRETLKRYQFKLCEGIYMKI